MSQCFGFVQCYVIGVIALDLVLRIALACMMNVALIVHVPRMHAYDTSPDAAGFGVPAYVIANFERLGHARPPEIFNTPRQNLDVSPGNGSGRNGSSSLGKSVASIIAQLC